LTCPADKRNALYVFVVARSLANKHQVGIRMANPEHHLGPAKPVQLASRAVADVGPNHLERLHSRVARLATGAFQRRIRLPASAIHGDPVTLTPRRIA
jgi:hypothetical protein